MWLDPGFWTQYFQSVFAHQIAVFGDSILDRVMPAFDKLDEEAEKVADQEYERLGHLPATDDNFDMADLAERARDVGIEYFISMTNVRQALMNIAAAGLYHLFEQQLLLFHRRQVLHPSEENEIELLKIGELKKRLSDGTINIEKLPSWPKLTELSLVANAVKHGEGRSAEGLRPIRPDLFVYPELRADDFFGKGRPPTIDVPLSGEDLYVTVQDLQDYKQASQLLGRVWRTHIERGRKLIIRAHYKCCQRRV